MLYYLIMAVLMGISLFSFILIFDIRKTNYYIIVAVSLMMLSNVGYLLIAVSQNVREAILANKISYVGGCFIPPVTFFLICTICNYRMPAWVKKCMYSYSTLVYIMVLTIGVNDFYYTEVSLSKYGDVSILEHSYGPGHIFFYVLLYGYMLIQGALLVHSVVKKRTVSRKSLWALAGMLMVNILLFIVGRVINLKIEIMPLMYVLDGIICIYLYRSGLIYNIEDNIAAAFEKQESFAYIMVGNSMDYLGCNSVAANIFPALSECVIDRKMDRIPGVVPVLEWVEAYLEKDIGTFEYESSGRHYEGRIEKLWFRKKVRGYILELRDDTDKWKYMELLSEHNAKLESFSEELERKVTEQTIELKEKQKQLEKRFAQTVVALSEAVDAKDRYTSGHSTRVAQYARMIAMRMGKSRQEQEEIYYAGLLHDVGKIRVPAEIINKPGKLTEEEFNIIKLHPVTGYHILRTISEDSYISIAARYHHERYDGKGYPNGLFGENIPEIARILGVADSYDAMASNRSYRKALPQQVVRGEIEKGKGTQFDPGIADIMLQLMAEDTEYSLKEPDMVKRRILTVDDEAMNNKIITHIMREEPMYEVVCAGSGKEALEILAGQSFDLILLDVYMPQMDGMETLKCIREKYQTPVVLMTSDKSLSLSTEFSAYGCDDYITKPFLPVVVKEIVYNMTERVNRERQ